MCAPFLPARGAQCIDRSRGQGAAAALSAQRNKRQPASEPDQRFLRLGGADEPDREAEHEGRRGGAGGDDFEQMK